MRCGEMFSAYFLIWCTAPRPQANAGAQTQSSHFTLFGLDIYCATHSAECNHVHAFTSRHVPCSLGPACADVNLPTAAVRVPLLSADRSFNT